MFKSRHFSKSIEANKDDLRKTWKILKQAMGRNVKATAIDDQVKRDDDDMIFDKLKISKAFSEHFVSLGESLPKRYRNLRLLQEITYRRPRKTVQNSFFRQVQPNQIIKLLSRSNSGKASGLNLASNKSL